jgi:predicted ABC-type ATPase
VRQSGHHVPEGVVRRRFVLGLTNVFTLFEGVADSWQMLDNSFLTRPRLIAERRSGSPAVIVDEQAWRRLNEEAR